MEKTERKTKRAYMYVVECADGTLYTGYTTDVERRIKTHNAGKGAKYTKSRLPVKLIYQESFDSKEAAMSAESYFKQKHDNKNSIILTNTKLNQKRTLLKQSAFYYYLSPLLRITKPFFFSLDVRCGRLLSLFSKSLRFLLDLRLKSRRPPSRSSRSRLRSPR